jgi:hypothetical protein
MKRVIAALLWFNAGWTVGAFASWMTGVDALVGPLLGIVAAALIAGDPAGIIWKAQGTAKSVGEAASGAVTSVGLPEQEPA